MQSMAELVKHRRHVIEADQRRLSGRRLRQIGHVVNDRQRTQELGLADEFGHPRTTILVVPLEVVAIKERQRLAIGIGDLENAYVRRVYRNVHSLLERDPIQAIRCVENTVPEDTVEFEEGFDLRLVEIIFRLAHLLAVELSIPGRQGKSSLLR